eukprot:Em0002g1242a
MCTQVKESLAEETLQEIEKENALSNESSHTSKNGIGNAVSANGVSTCQFTVESNEDDIDDEVCYIGKDMCICLNGCKCKSRAVHMNLFDPAVFEHSSCDSRIKILEVELRTALDENERLKMENQSLTENFKRVAASTGDAIEMQKNITKASITIEELKQTVASLAEQVPQNRKVSESNSKYYDVIGELKHQLMETKYLLRTAEEDVKLHANNLSAMETLMTKQLAQLGAELQTAKEELAVKTSQVKQYQEQMETYRLQLHVNDVPVHAEQDSRL